MRLGNNKKKKRNNKLEGPFPEKRTLIVQEQKKGHVKAPRVFARGAEQSLGIMVFPILPFAKTPPPISRQRLPSFPKVP